jgi:hypothetical protein
MTPKKVTEIDVLGGSKKHVLGVQKTRFGGPKTTFWGVKTTFLEGEKKGGIEKSRKKSL